MDVYEELLNVSLEDITVSLRNWHRKHNEKQRQHRQLGDPFQQVYGY